MPDAPLNTLRVLDIGTYIAAPYAATLFGEFGAEVIKVELPGVGDACRRFGTPTKAGDTLVWASEGRNKKSVCLDLRMKEGAQIFCDLVKISDVVLENFQVGTLERWGLGWDRLSEINPDLVMVRISGFGQTGPYAGRPGFARIANAFGGMSFLSGSPDREPANPGSASLADYVTGMFGAIGALIALRARDNGAGGQYIDIGLYESVFRLLDEVAPAYAAFGKIRQRRGGGTENVCPHNHFKTKDGKWAAISCTNDKMFARLASTMGRPELAESDNYGTTKARLDDRDRVDRLVSDWAAQLSFDELMRQCEAGKVPCGPVMAIDEIFRDPQYAARQNLVEVDDERFGKIVIPGIVPRLSSTPGEIRWAGRALGSDTDEVLTGLLGFDAEEIARLRAIGAV